MLAVALDAVARGWHVFPVHPESKRPPAFHGQTSCPHTGICATTHQGWEQRAVADPDLVRWIWGSTRYGGCNVGVACGPSNLVLVDLDVPRSPTEQPKDGSRRGEPVRTGADTFRSVCAQAGQPVPLGTLTGATPSGGTHLFYRAPQGVQLGNTQNERGNGLGWKIDTRGHGGYAMAPGSTTPDGPYRITRELPMLDLPTWLVHRLAPRPVTAVSRPVHSAVDRLPAYVTAAIRGEVDKVAAAAPNEHNIVLYVASTALGQLVAGGLLPASRAEVELTTAAVHMITDTCGCTDNEVRRVITAGLRAGAAKPRTAPTRRGAA
ncbi:bifunctional DNA primase/polymerase [Umezawaea tangerina]|uniref:Bifunctional DNA primase/polymerase-like protein n=1 Tax=Umezawaea tangerina TaxID=84725 RepID=A0A2T0SS88_9PSEU|nr:bifunctional DNA primase/polymerase [Umezawaea tangerina]PRY36266.1 bifunctional DNA primase/polymerase-like protein [Umezawaea tangerina]